MQKIKAICVVSLLACLSLGNVAFKRWDYQYSVIGKDIFNGNYIVTTIQVICIPAPVGVCTISTTVPANFVNGQLEVDPGTATVLSQGLNF